MVECMENAIKSTDQIIEVSKVINVELEYKKFGIPKELLGNEISSNKNFMDSSIKEAQRILREI